MEDTCTHVGRIHVHMYGGYMYTCREDTGTHVGRIHVHM